MKFSLFPFIMILLKTKFLILCKTKFSILCKRKFFILFITKFFILFKTRFFSIRKARKIFPRGIIYECFHMDGFGLCFHEGERPKVADSITTRPKKGPHKNWGWVIETLNLSRASCQFILCLLFELIVSKSPITPPNRQPGRYLHFPGIPSWYYADTWGKMPREETDWFPA